MYTDNGNKSAQFLMNALRLSDKIRLYKKAAWRNSVNHSLHLCIQAGTTYTLGAKPASLPQRRARRPPEVGDRASKTALV